MNIITCGSPLPSNSHAPWSGSRQRTRGSSASHAQRVGRRLTRKTSGRTRNARTKAAFSQISWINICLFVCLFVVGSGGLKVERLIEVGEYCGECPGSEWGGGARTNGPTHLPAEQPLRLVNDGQERLLPVRVLCGDGFNQKAISNQSVRIKNTLHIHTTHIPLKHPPTCVGGSSCVSPVAAKRRRATATPKIPPMKCAGIMTSSEAVRPKRLSAMRMGRLGASCGTNEAAKWSLDVCAPPLPPPRTQPPPPCRRRLLGRCWEWRRNHCSQVVGIVCVFVFWI
jgi:hypothetical protein